MPNPLPIINLGYGRFYVDERLGQIRNVNNPHDYESVPTEVIQHWKSNGWCEPRPVISQFENLGETGGE